MIYVIIAIGAAIVIIIAVAIYLKRSTEKFKSIADKCAVLVEKANTDIANGINPSHYVSDAEVKAVGDKYKDLYDKVSGLCSDKRYRFCRQYDNLFLQFKKNIERLASLQEQNNHNYQIIQEINANIDEAYKRTVRYFSDKNYLAESQRLEYKKLSSRINSWLEAAKERDILNYTAQPDKCQSVLTAHLESVYRKTENNKRFISKQLAEQSVFFDTILKHPLTQEQRNAIVTLEDNVLTISSAGSGKTSTIEGKVKYLVEKRNVDPNKILLITYTRKASESLTERLGIKGLSCLTFHKLASNIIETVKGYKPSFCEAGIFQTIYHELKKDPEFLQAMNTYLLSYQSQMKDEFEYDDAKSYYADRKKYGIQAALPDMDGNPVFTKSEQERKICNFLSMNGIAFRYEEPYIHDEYEPGYRKYKPDFTIYFTENGKERSIYLEHFGIDKNGKVPKWFGDGKAGGWEKANADYNEGIIWKRNTHKKYKTTLIETTSADFSNGKVFERLLKQLKDNHVPIKPISGERLYNAIINGNSRKEKALIELISSFINLMKANCIPSPEAVLPNNCVSTEDIRDKYIIDNIISPFFIKYQTALAKRGEMDFTDAIITARDICNECYKPGYEYILVDEFQDISVDRYEFLKSLRSSDPFTKLFCVGDDWQSIYRFAGSNMALFKDFGKFFGYTAECKMETTFRFGEPLASMSSKFILKNPEQKGKAVIPYSQAVKTELKTISYKSPDNLRSMLSGILTHLPAGKTAYILGRYSFDVDILSSTDFEIVMKGSKIYIRHKSKEYQYLTVHQSKGLEADYVLLINCNSGAYGFPSTISDDHVLSRVLSESDSFEFGEERRLFYVAITRAKRMTYVLYHEKHPSTFINEIGLDIPPQDRCPVCKNGRRIVIRSGVAKNGRKFSVYACSDSAAGCDYHQIVFENCQQGSKSHNYRRN